jgi:DNA-binding NtrC family response regulator
MATAQGIARTGRDRRPHVLLIEDDRAIREIVSVVLAEEGYLVDNAERPEAALDALRRDAYDLVLTDLFGGTPDAGLAAVRPIVESAAPAPVIGCSGHEITLDQARSAGLASFVPKPFELDQLLDCLATQLSE